MKHKRNLVLRITSATLAVLPFLMSSFLFANDNNVPASNRSAAEQCLIHIQIRDYEAIPNSCTETFGRTLISAFIADTYYSLLGTQDSLTESGKRLKQLAIEGDANAQFVFAELQWTLVPSRKIHSNIRTRVESEELFWYEKAAEQGLAMAMLRYTTKIFQLSWSLPTKRQHEKGKQYAKILMDNFGPEFAPNYIAFDYIPHQQNVDSFLESRLADLGALTNEEIHEYATSYHSGRFSFDYDIGIRKSANVQLQPNLERAKQLYKYLLNERQDPKAAYSLAWMEFPKSSANATEKQLQTFFFFMKQSFHGNHPSAIRWVGLYLACNNASVIGKKHLLKAEKLGNTDAEDDLYELEEYGDISECPSVPNNKPFIAAFL